MDIKQLEAFCMVVRQGSFSKAARVLGVSQPTVSAHISTLEKELGCELLIRTSNSILPTDKGATLLSYAQGIMSLRQKAMEELSREDSRYTGSITIAASSVRMDLLLRKATHIFSVCTGRFNSCIIVFTKLFLISSIFRCFSIVLIW